jgi:hypothetical protein
MDFAILPPYFVRSDDTVSALIDKAIRLCFGRFPQNLSRVLEFCLASVVHHQGFLRETLPAQHPLFFSSLFMVENLLEELQPHVTCKIGDSPDDPIRATGITNHTENVIRLERLERKMNDLTRTVDESYTTIETKIDDVPDRVAARTEDLLEDRAEQSGNITSRSIASIVESTFTRHGLPEILEHIRNPPPIPAQSPAAPNAEALNPLSNQRAEGRSIQDQFNDVSPRRVFVWGGRFHRFPEGFQIPSCRPKEAWVLYLCGNPAANIPPLRFLETRDLAGNRNRFYEYRNLMKRLEAEAIELDHLDPTHYVYTIEKAQSIFEEVCHILPYDQIPETRKRQRNAAVWKTIGNILRKQDAKRRRQNSQRPNESQNRQFSDEDPLTEDEPAQG